MSRRVALFGVLVVTLSWNAAILAAPRDAPPRVAALTYLAGALICHQRPERSFRHEGAQYPVCARCLGLYLGAVGGVLLWTGIGGVGRSLRGPAHRICTPKAVRKILLVAALPTALSVAISSVGWWDAGNVTRAALAVPLGATIAAVIAAVAAGDLR